MSAIVGIFNYIVANNPWYLIPLRLLQAFGYQMIKRTQQGVLSKRLFNGKKILLFSHSPNSSAFVYTAIPDKAEIFALRQLADQNTIFIDVGANVGDYSVLLMDKVKTIYAFEAHPATARLCKMNFLLNGVNEEQVIVKAVSDNQEPKWFSDLGEASPINSQVKAASNAIQVPAVSLDHFIEQLKPDASSNFILKVDVEGFEHEVFAGAQRFLRDYAVRGIVFERFSTHCDAILQQLQALGFSTQAISQNNILCLRASNG